MNHLECNSKLLEKLVIKNGIWISTSQIFSPPFISLDMRWALKSVKKLLLVRNIMHWVQVISCHPRQIKSSIISHVDFEALLTTILHARLWK